MPNDGAKITFFESFFTAAQIIPDAARRGEFYDGILGFAFRGEEPEFTDPLLQMGWAVIRPVMQKSRNMRRPGNCNAAATQKNADETQKNALSTQPAHEEAVAIRIGQ